MTTTAQPLSREAERVIRALMQADGDALRVNELHARLARMSKAALANALSELARTGRAAEIDGRWHLLGDAAH